MRWIVVAAMLLSQIAVGQLRVIPREKFLAATNPKAIASALKITPERTSFGTIDEMSGVWQGSVKLTNGGADTIAITQLKSTCGCLQVSVGAKVLAPQQSVEVSLKYYPRGHAGEVYQRVFVYTNLSTEQPSAILQLAGRVTASADRSDDYPYERGALRLRQDSVVLNLRNERVGTVACMNGGSTELRLGADTLLTPKSLRVRFEPSVLAPLQEGDMIVEYRGEGVNSDLPLKIFIKGLNVAPRYSVVDVKIEQ